jgi:hypothetical protein
VSWSSRRADLVTGRLTRDLLQQRSHVWTELFPMCTQERFQDVLGARLRARSGQRRPHHRETRKNARLTRRSYSHRSCSSSFIHSSGSCSHFCRSSCLSGNIRVIKTSANCCTKSGETGRAEVPSQSPSMALMSRRA